MLVTLLEKRERNRGEGNKSKNHNKIWANTYEILSAKTIWGTLHVLNYYS